MDLQFLGHKVRLQGLLVHHPKILLEILFGWTLGQTLQIPEQQVSVEYHPSLLQTRVRVKVSPRVLLPIQGGLLGVLHLLTPGLQ